MVETINLSFLTETERELILEVLKRDEELRRVEEQRVKRLKAEFIDIKRKGAKRASGRYSERSCGRCQEPLGRLASNASQCQACKHQVCRNCRFVRPNGSWVCSVCAKEVDLKKSSGDWFYDQKVNRFSTVPGHGIVRQSLKSRPLTKKRETTAETLLNSADLYNNQAVPVPKPRQKDMVTANKGSQEASDHGEVREQQRSDTDSVEKGSLSSYQTESSRSTPQLPQKTSVMPRSSPAGSSVSSVTASAKTHSPQSSISGTETASLTHHMNAYAIPESMHDVDCLFKKSVRRVHKISDMNRPTSTLDLRGDSTRDTVGSMGDRSKSVPGLNVQDDNEEGEEEEEDIDDLVNIHRKTVAGNTGSLHSSSSTLGSMMSIYSEAGDYDTVDVSGDITFSVSYDEKSHTLCIHVKGCRELAYADPVKKKCNPYVKSYLLPDKSRQSKKKTSIKHNTNNPTYNESLKYSIHRSQLLTRSLQLSVWHNDRFGRNAFLGEVELPLDCYNIDLAHEETVALRGKTSHSPPSVFAQYKGELVISLKYVTAKQTSTEKSKGKKSSKSEDGAELHVLIKEARNLSAMKSGGTSDSFVKGYLLPAKNSKTAKRKTPVVKKTLNPQYNHTFVYKDLTLEQLKSMCLELTVWDKEAMSSNDFLGGVRLSSGAGTIKSGKEEWVTDSTGEEVSLWQKMMQYPDSWAEGTLPLRSSMGKAK
ncbi:synaptotagmin-like protein 4 [Chanos chanos]|uniref:Synaptotagmin-like protein 4 n=1 Tax=Chanos chanos TaxID=29144 RepID=A0A6J2UNV6_CHACN|nr:synaptotagmin-like protein 4 [Chanos chanos]